MGPRQRDRGGGGNGGLEDLSDQLLLRRRTWYRNRRTGAMVQKGRVVWSQTD